MNRASIVVIAGLLSASLAHAQSAANGLTAKPAGIAAVEFLDLAVKATCPIRLVGSPLSSFTATLIQYLTLNTGESSH